MGAVARVRGLEHALEGLDLGGGGVGQERAIPARVVGFGVEDVKDGAREEAVGGDLPVVAGVLFPGGDRRACRRCFARRALREGLCVLPSGIETERIEGTMES